MSADTPLSPSLEMVPIVSTDQLRFAVARALAAVSQSSTPAPLGASPYASLTGEAVARMAAAIAHAFPAEHTCGEQLLKGLIWRGVFAFSDVVSDSRFVAFGRSDNKQIYVSTPLMNAVASIPMPFGGDVPVDAIYSSVCEAVERAGHSSEMTTITEAVPLPAAQPA